MIGSGQANIRTVVSIAQSQALDQPLSGAMAESATSNEERDLHRWLKDVYNVHLEPYMIHMTLQAVWLNFRFPLISSNVHSLLLET